MTKQYIPRTIFAKVAKHLFHKEITLIIGPRQVGKTILLEQMREYLIKDKNIDSDFIFYFNLDIVQDRELFESQQDFIQFIQQRSAKGKIYIFIDEAQRIKNPGIFFKGVYDSNLPAKLVLTGSSTLEIRAKIHESLTGRKRVFHLLPLSFLEILHFKNQLLFNLVDHKEKIIDYDRKKILKIFLDYCVWGGYPQVVLADEIKEKEEFLKEIFSSYLEKDVVGFLKVENESNFTKLVKLLAAQIGSLINTAELSALVATDRYTIDRYLMALEKTFIVYNLKPFYTNARQEIIKASKSYFIDNGLRNMSLGNLSKTLTQREDKGHLLENAILKELLVLKFYSSFNLRFWRSKQKSEVDFIVEKGLEIIPIEVKSRLMSNKVEANFLGFIERYKPKKALIINLGYQGKREINDTEIFFIFPYELKNYI